MSQARASITRRMALKAGGVVGASLLWAPPALAHRAQTVLSTVMWNASASALDITHRLHGHDAELFLSLKAGGGAVDITVLRNQEQSTPEVANCKAGL